MQNGTRVNGPDPPDSVQIRRQEVDHPLAEKLNGGPGSTERRDGNDLCIRSDDALEGGGPEPLGRRDHEGGGERAGEDL